jgi:glucose-1-phosphate thymidylyltransferase
MKETFGILLAGGKGTRLLPMTKVTNKHLLPIYDKPMIYYPLNTLITAGIKNIMVITGTEHMGDIINLLGSGKDFGVKFTYKVQDEAGGIAQALGLCKDFVGDNNCMVVLGDNIIEDNLKDKVDNFIDGCHLFLKKVSDPKRFGVPVFEDDKIVRIEEKPINPKSDFAITGVYIYDSSVFKKIDEIEFSDRGEMEITDVNNAYIEEGKINGSELEGFWSDAGKPDSLYNASTYIKNKR